MKLTPLLVAFLTITASAAFAAKDEESSTPPPPIAAAQAVLDRVTAHHASHIRMEIIPAVDGRDAYEYSAGEGELTLRGSSTVALCRAFYDYARAHGMGQDSWAVPFFTIPEHWPDSASTHVVCPYAIRHAYNVVTAGYTFPYWTWDRWQQELDYQALHGFNMLMAPTATEAIKERVWLKLGLTQEEIDADTCGPAYLPWYRMGNICAMDGPLPKEWNTDQVALQHKILDRMHELGMEPMVQGFAGFVPKAFARIHPETKLYPTHWISALPGKNRPVLLMPDDPQFAVITKTYMEEWTKEFGPLRYYLVDTFNELSIPKTGRPITETLATYGEKTWEAIHAANPDAVWGIQGWTFGYQSWPPANLKALFSKVPDDRMLVLDYANDYRPIYKRFDSFFGKTWLFGYLPNMGGKTAYCGNLPFYAISSAQVLKDPDHGNLRGFTISGEGSENNDVVHELLADVAWTSDPINLDDWFKKYCTNRYGACPPAMTECWNLLRAGVYSHYVHHPGFNWQHFNSAVDHNPNIIKAASLFVSCSDELKNSPLYRADAMELSALALGLAADNWYSLTKQSYASGDMSTFDKASARTLELLTQVDSLMESHPYDRMERWIDFARSHSSDPALQKYYEADARRIVTYWGPGVQNYSCRVWSGLIRDFYREGMAREFAAMKNNTRKVGHLAVDYIQGAINNPFKPSADPLADAKTWIEQAVNEPFPAQQLPNSIGQWNPGTVNKNWTTAEWNVDASDLPKLKGVLFTFTRGKSRLEIRSVALVADGKVVAEDKHDAFAGARSKTTTYNLNAPANAAANNGCLIRAVIKGDSGTDSNGIVTLILSEQDSASAP